MSRVDVDRLALRVQLASFEGTVLTDELAALLQDGLGGVCLFGSNLTGDVRAVVSSLREVSPSLIVAIDEEGGDVTRLHAATGSPVLGAAALGRLDDVDVTRATAARIGAELADLGINLNLAPVADVNSATENPVIGVRSYSADPHVAARHVAAYVEGLQSTGVAASVKHFPGHGDTTADSHLALPRLDVSLETLRARELVPFRAAVAAGTQTVMTAHIVVSAIDADRPATLSPDVTAVLRDDLGFAGVLVSDALDMAGASAVIGVPAAAVAALNAGADLLCIGADKPASLMRDIQTAIVAAVASGGLAIERLEEAAARVQDLAQPQVGRAASEASQTQVGRAAREASARRDQAPLDVQGLLPDLTNAFLVSLDSEVSIAVGEIAWCVPPDLTVKLADPAAATQIQVAARDRHVILQTRDAHRHSTFTTLMTALGEQVALVVEYGWPAPWHLSTPRVCTYGCSQPATLAIAGLFAEQGLTR